MIAEMTGSVHKLPETYSGPVVWGAGEGVLHSPRLRDGRAPEKRCGAGHKGTECLSSSSSSAIYQLCGPGQVAFDSVPQCFYL